VLEPDHAVAVREERLVGLELEQGADNVLVAQPRLLTQSRFGTTST